MRRARRYRERYPFGYDQERVKIELTERDKSVYSIK